MKRNILAILLLGLAIFVTGCSNFNFLFLDKEEPAEQGSLELNYVVEQLVLTKGYQNTEQKIELVQKNNEIRLFVYPGLLKSAGIQVKDIIKDGSKVTVHLVNQDNPKSRLVIPQISILLSNIRPSEITDASFSIVNENYSPIKINYGIIAVINKLKADMKISSNTNPAIRLFEDKDKLFWEIRYENIFDRDNKEVPLINLTAIVDANTGELVKSSKALISSLIDEGLILSLSQEYGLLYVNNLPGNMGDFESCLWSYDVESGERKFLYGTNHSINSAEFSPDGSNLFFLENDGTHKMLYTLQLEDLKAVKLALPGDFTPIKAQWKDSNHLYISEAPEKSRTRIMLYNLQDNSIESLYSFEMDMLNFVFSDKTFAAAQRDGENINRKIYTSENIGSFKLVDNGWNLTSLGNGQIAFLKHEQKTDINNLIVFDPTDSDKGFKINRNFAAIYAVDDGELLLVERINGGSDFSISLLQTNPKKEEYLGRSSSDKILLHKDSGLLFVDLVIPYQSEMSEIIFTVSINELK